ncbi:MAG: FGGY family carbohydrate kinase [Ilumatobacteraceae bacterium]
MTATIRHLRYRAFPPSTPFPGLVEVDAVALAGEVLATVHEVLDQHAGSVDAVGITDQRATTIVWDRATGEPIGPGLGWQDLRTVTECIVAAAEHGLALAPNQSATKIAWLLDHVDGARDRDLCFGTVDSWLVWSLTGGRHHVTDHSNASVTGLLRVDGSGWDEQVCETLANPDGDAAVARRHGGHCRRRGDGAARLATCHGARRRPAGVARRAGLCPRRHGQDHVRHGRHARRLQRQRAARTCCSHAPRHVPARRLVTRRRADVGARGHHARCGSNVDWLRDDLGLFAESDDSEALAAPCDSTDGAMYVPALLGLGTPRWDYGARGTLVGLTRGSTAAHVTRAVLEGVAHRGVDLIEAAEADVGSTIASLRIDGGMSRNGVFVQAPGRSRRPSGRGVTRRRGDHARRRVPGRSGRRDVVGDGRHRCVVVAVARARTVARLRQRQARGRSGAMPSIGPQDGFLNCRHWTSRVATPAVRRGCWSTT